MVFERFINYWGWNTNFILPLYIRDASESKYMKYVDNTEFQSNSRQIEQDIENTLDRVIDDYSHHWQGVLGETIQNSFDAWATNRFERRTLPEDHPLEIRFEVDLNSREFRASDNAGGMPRETFYSKFAGLDTPGEEKESGGAGGSYGRGFHVIAGLGEWTYAETNHDGFRGGIVVSGARQMETEAELELDTQGTYVEVDDCDVDVLVDLTEWSIVRDYIQSRFQPLLERDNVSITYDIEGEVHEVEPVDLSGFDVLWTGELDFTFGGEDRTLTDVVIYDATSSDQEVPFEGIQMMKRNQNMETPFMRVHEYKPRQVRHLNKMFGFCDASTLCPKYENNAHNRFKNAAPSHTGLKDKLEELEREHFVGTPTDLDERDEIVTATINVVNKLWESNPFDAETDAPEDSNIDGLVGEVVGNGGQPEEDEEGDESSIQDIDESGSEDPQAIEDLDIDWSSEEADDEEDPSPTLTLSTRKQRVNIDTEVQVWASIENPSASPHEKFSVTATLDGPDEGAYPEDLETFHIEVEPGQGTSGDQSWVVETQYTGTYVVDGSLFDRDSSENEELDVSQVEFVAGEPDEETASEDEEYGSNPVSFLEDITFVRAEDEPDFRADLTEGERGMLLIVNSAHPEWKHSVNLDGKSGISNQTLTLIRWANEAITNRMLLDEIEDELTEITTEEGERLSEKMSTFVRETVIDQMSEMVAAAHEEVEA